MPWVQSPAKKERKEESYFIKFSVILSVSTKTKIPVYRAKTLFLKDIWTKLMPFLFNKVFKDHAIDGETLPLLTEEHLRGTLGLKLGPALKIQSQVW